MLFSSLSRKSRGFTLVELAIVLTVVSMLMVGLWRLMNSGSSQLRDQAAADLQGQLIAAVKGYLSTTEGQGLVTALGSGLSDTLALPSAKETVSACQSDTVMKKDPGLCNFLPPGFYSGTTNAYGQTFGIGIRNDNAPSMFSFMIMTLGGETIPDTDGARIASLIGNDGGFVYSATNCGSPVATTACGAFNAWSASATSYNFSASTYSGHVASRTTIGAGTADVVNWLARANIGGQNVTLPDGTSVPDFNTLQADTFLGQYNLKGVQTPAILSLGGGTLEGTTVSTDPTKYGVITNIREAKFSTSTTSETALTLSDLGTTTCPQPTTLGSSSSYACSPVATIHGYVSIYGNESIDGMLSTNILYVNSTIYNPTSDRRLKHDIVPLSHALDNLSKIQGVSFVMNKGNEKKLGVIAQDVEKVYPQLIHDVGSGYKGVDYMGLIGPLVAAVNELRVQNETLSKQVQDQQKAIEDLRGKAEGN